MKITGARTEPFAAIRKRALARAGAQVAVREVSAPDSAAFLGLTDADLTPKVIEALQTLMTEIQDLRNEVSALKLRLNEAQNLADMDALTPVLNRRAFLREMKRVAAFAQRYGSPASVVFFDLDDFKRVNDRFGHAAGDQALKAVAKRLQNNVRESDIVGRMGGDEFAVLLAQADKETAMTKARALADAVMGAPVEFGEWSAPLHISYGVREIEPGADPETALAEADAAMFMRKRKAVA
ncbi:GGDEF domain-containing protein [Caulobacter segnis]|uniref:GGDEF domain-containing protein n=1 Tax=Caulobacter segnis TaxID=88688 RepID=UPI002855FB4A|nr:GGDEF domain-containing protein [Caulobacter segnis]MDR6627486.1 diguanylate cyclase (GGDEF)-like protein [Caulobacter segnis]